MQTLTRAFAVLAIAVLTHSAAATAQEAPPAKLPIGTWTGSVTPPGEAELPVTFDVASQNDTLSITIHAGEHGTFKAEGITVEAARILFRFTPGPTVTCVLSKREDASYAGECTEDDGSAAQMVMIPPKKS